MKAFQCSKCEHMKDYETHCNCCMNIDPRPNHREKGNREKCLDLFEPVKNEWFAPFSWEK